MGEVREYTVTVNGYETVMNLNEADAERLGGVPHDGRPDDEPRKARAAPNKARGPQGIK